MTAGTFRERFGLRLATAQLSITAGQLDALSEYWHLLERWNSKVNLTALPLRDYPPSSIDRLLIEPLVGATLMPVGVVRWFDIGSGGGSPAIPLKVVRPETTLTMVESRSRKGAFLREVVRSLGLPNTDIAVARADEVAHRQAGQADCVSVRAVRLDKPLSDACLRLLRRAGCLMLFESAGYQAELGNYEVIRSVPVPSTESAVRLVVPRGTND